MYILSMCNLHIPNLIRFSVPHNLKTPNRKEQIMQRILRVLLLILLLAVPRLILAQGVTTASISGIVTDDQGQPVPGASVMAVHTPSGTKYGTSTQLDGRFYVRGLRVGGPYVITVSGVGYKTQEVRDVNLEIGQNLEMNFKLTVQAVSVGGVEIIAERNALMNTNRTGAATTVSRRFIETFPTITRSFQDFESLTPQFVGNSALGRNNRYNNIQLDGTNYNDLFGLPGSGTPGGQAGTTPISLDAIQEFQVTLAPFDVRQGGFTGAEVNAITRSGTNQFRGSVYFFGQNQNFVGTSPDTLKTPYPNFSNVQTGFRLGGPIVKDKLFFFVNGEITRRRQPLYNTMPVADSVIQRFNTIMQGYGYNPGGTSTYTLLQPSNKLFVRLDYNISETNKLTIRDNYINASQDNLSRGITSLGFSSNDYTFNDKTNSLAATLNSTFSPTLSNELILGYTAIRDNRVVPSPVSPMITVRDASIPNNGSFVAGTEEFSGANGLNQDIWELTDNLSWVNGAHLFTFGTHEELFGFNNLFIRDYYGWYQFNSLSDLQAGKPNEYRYSYSNIPGTPEPSAKWNAVQYGLYAQDEWTATSNLKLTFGLRLDVPTFPTSPLNNPTFDSTFAFMSLRTDQVPKASFLFAPRLGFNWDVTGDRLTILRGGVGVFSGRVPYVWISNQYSNTGMDILRVDQYGLPAGFFSPNPNNQPRPGVTPGLSPIKTTEIDITANNFKMPQVLRADVAVDRQLAFGIVATIEGIYSRSINDVLYQDININPTGQYLASDGRPLFGTNPGVGKTYWNVNKINPAFTNVVYMTNTNKPYEYSITAELQRQFGEGIFSYFNIGGLNDQLFANVSYTYGHSYDQNAVTSSQAISQWRYNPVPGNPNNPPLAISDFDVPNRIVASVSEKVEYAKGWATTLSLFYAGQSGSPFSYIYYGDVNGDGQNLNDLVYVPKNSSDIILTTNNYAQLDAFINGDSYLSSHRGQIVPRNGGRAPWQNVLNLRLAQDIPTVEGQSLEFTLDIINVLNLLNHSWGYIKYVQYGTYTLLSYKGLNAQGQPQYAFYPPKGGTIFQTAPFASRWQLQLGARYTF